MKQILSLLCAAAAAVTLSSAAFAAPGAGDNSPGSGIYRSVHDLTNGPNGTGAPLSVSGFQQDAEKRLCAYCHTPHHAIKVGDTAAQGAQYLPLWSHEVSSQPYTPYKSASFDLMGGHSMDATDPLVGPSRLCMSCHDGVTAVDNYYGNTPGHKMASNSLSFEGNPVISSNGESNHPLGFAMTDVIPGYAGATYSDPSILSINASSMYQTGLTDSVPVLSRLYSGAVMTCSSCHDVHNTLNKVSYQTGATNFLLLGSQKNSGICLSCHTQGGGDTGSNQTSVHDFTY